MSKLRKIFIPGLLVIAVAIFGVLVFSSAGLKKSNDNHVRTVQEAWVNLTSQGAYEFSTTVEQITFPAPTINNAGRSSERELYQIDGETNLNEETMFLKIWQQGGSLANNEDAIEIKVEEGEAYGRFSQTEWIKLDQFQTNNFAPGQDAASYLTAARNVRIVDVEELSLPDQDGKFQSSIVSHYTFDVDSMRFADLMRDQLIKELQRKGKLPVGMQLDFSDQYRSMEASGELWVNDQNLPVRMKIEMVMSPFDGGEQVKAIISTDFYAKAHGTRYASAPFQVLGTLGLTSVKQLMQAIQVAGFLALSVILVFMLFRFTSQRVQLAVISIVIITSLVISPLWQNVKAAEFNEEMMARQEAVKIQRESLEAARESSVSGKTDSWNFHKDPLSTIELSTRLLSIDETSDHFSSWFSPSWQPLLDVVGDSEADQDGDGLTDTYEDEYDDTILDKTKADTDSDGLLDGVELKLNLLPGEEDSDNDGINDAVEVVSFFYADQDWYSDPTNNDSDSDGILDGAECYERVIRDGNPTPGVCKDTDNDGTPDIFDTDDDNDGIPSNVDQSPYYADPAVYTSSSPFTFRVENLQTDTPAILDLQIQPENEKHLTYIMNVLDWPSGDTDGQIMRITNSDFGDNLTSDQRSQDPKASNGDMRLIPMLEFRMDGDSIPFPLTNAMDVGFNNEQIEATFTVTAAGSNQVLIEKKDGPNELLTLFTASGNCDEFSDRRQVGVFDPGGAYTQNFSLGIIAEGNRVFIVENSAGNELGCVQPFAAHGTLTDRVVDVSKLAQYGASARNDTNGDILVYAPLTMENDSTGSAPVAFRTRIPYLNEGDRLNNHDQQVKMIWMLNMLTDVCKPISSDFDPSSGGEWCDSTKPERWVTDVPRVVHTYDDSFRVAGMTIVEDHGVDMNVIFEEPAVDDELNYDDDLWALAYGLQGTFMAGDETITLDEIYDRFDRDANHAVPADDIRLWNLQKDGFQVERYSYTSEDDQYRFISDEVFTLLDGYFGSYKDQIDAITLLYARNLQQRNLSLNHQTVSCPGGTCVFDFSGVDLTTQSILNWAPFQWNGSKWDTYPLEDYLDLLEANLRKTAEYNVQNVTDDERDIIDGKINMARFTYETYFRGLVMLTQVNGSPVVNMPALLDDQQIFNEFYQNNTKGQFITKVVKTLTEILIIGIEKNPNFYLITTKTDKVNNFFKAMKEGTAQKLSKITNLLNSTLKKVAFGIAAAVIIVGLAVCAILYLTNPDSLGGRVGGRILFAAIGLLVAGLGVTALTDAIAVVQAGKAVSNSVKGAAIVGAVIGVLITWGVFFYTWSSSGASAFSLEFNSMLADAIAATMTVILMAALMATGVGAIIVAVIAIIDGLIMVICAAAGAYEQEEDHWARQYVCIGISGWVTKIFKWFIYSQTFVVKYDDEDRLEFTGVDTDVQSKAAGMVSTNNMKVTVSIKNTITKSSVPFDWKAAAYWWQYSASNAKSATFEYRVQTSETDFDGSLERGDIRSQWKDAGSNKWSFEVDASSSGYPVDLPAAGINRDPTVYVSEGAAIPVQECWVIPPTIFTFFIPIPVCYIRTYSNTIHIDMSDSMTVDIFPPTLDEFYSLVQVDDFGYAFAWGRDASITFPKLKDADGDSLISKSFAGGNDPDDSLYDTDNDGLSDYYEISNGIDPRLFDTDDDGLYDLVEIQVGTDPLRKDSDGDGLTDAMELQGWFFVYDFEADGTPLETMVYSNPLIPDSDFDGITDLLEKIYGFNPNAPSDPNILEYELKMREYDSPVVMLQLEEENGSTLFADSSNFRFDGFCEGDVCPTAGLTGKYGNAARFDGGQKITLTTTAAAVKFEDNAPFTISGWVNFAGEGVILSKWWDDPAAKNNLVLSINSSGQLSLLSGTASVRTSSASVPEDTWTHIAAAFDGTTVAFYIDGNQSTCAEGNCAWDNSITYADSYFDVPIQVGAYGGTSDAEAGFSGYLDEVAVFDRALTQQEVQERIITARYNFNDSFVRPGETIAYQSLVKNLLNNRFAYGLLTTLIDKPEAVVDAASKFAPKTFVLYPDNPVVTGVSEEFFVDTIQIEPGYSESTDLTIEQSVSAQIVDRRTESNFAELWLKFNESAGASSFEDSSGNMPPRTAECYTSCPVSAEAGVFNHAVKFEVGKNQSLQLPDLDRLDLVNRGYTVSFWVKPASGSATGLPILRSLSYQFAVWLVPSGSNYTPVVYQDDSELVFSPWRKVTSNTWNHVVLVYSSSTGVLELYINGAKVASQSGVSPISANADLFFGSGVVGADYWVDDLRIFGRPISMLDISRLAERPVLKMSMESAGFGDSSVYTQSISVPKATPKLVNGIRGNAMFPDAWSNQGFVQVNGDGMLDLSDGAFTISTWIYPQYLSSGTWQGIFGKREIGSESSAYPTLERLGNKLRFGFGDGTAYRSKESGDVLTNNAWAHLVISFQPNGLGQYGYKLFVNDVLRDSYLFSQKPVSASTFYVGHSSHNYRLGIGRLDMDDEHDAGSHAEVYIKVFDGGSYVQRLPGWGDHTSMADGDDWHVNHNRLEGGFDTLQYQVWEEDDNPDDHCGTVTGYWYQDAASGTITLSNGFDGYLGYTFTRNSIPFYGRIDEIEIYRYGVTTEQVGDLYNSIPITANLPLNDRPSSDRFENKSEIGDLDDGECNGLSCPAAGTIGLINQAVRFDGQDDVITVPVKTTNDYMVSLWLNTQCENCGVYTLKEGNTTLNQLYTRGGNICGLTGSTEICSQGADLMNGQWHHIVYGNKLGATELWLDGEIVNQISGSAVTGSSSATAYLGTAASAANDYLSGQMDDVRIFRYSQPGTVVEQLKERAPFFLAHLDDKDASDGIYDDTPNDWDLVCSYDEDSDVSTCPKTGVEGRLINGVEYDGQNDILHLSQNQLSTDIESFTVSIWVNPVQPFASPQTLWTLWNQNNSAQKYGLALVPDGLGICVLTGSNPGTCDLDSNVSLIANTWNHITFVVNRTSSTEETYELYINGYRDSTATGNTGTQVTQGLGRFEIGNQSSGSNPHGPFAGVLDEVSIFSYALNEIDIRDMFHYQMEHVEEKDALTMTIDADDPTGELVSYDAVFPYTPNIDKLLHYETADQTSGIAMLEMTTQFGTLGIPRTATAPVCLDSSSGTSFCPTLDPVEGEGLYSLNFRLIDRVGNQSFEGPYQYYVDGTGPRIVVDYYDGQIVGAKNHPTLENTWYLPLSGRISDELLADGNRGSGLDVGTVQVVIYSENGEITGDGVVKPTIVHDGSGYRWSVDYLFRETEPTGKLDIEVRSADKIGNQSTRLVSIYLDATAPVGELNDGVVPNPETESDLDFSTALDESKDNSNDILKQQTIRGTASDIPGVDLPYMSSTGQNAATQVNAVEMALSPSLQASFQFNEPYPDGVLAWLPLDKEEVPLNENGDPDPELPERYYLDMSPYQISGDCEGEACPSPGLVGHKNGSMYFDGDHKLINLGQNVDLAGRSFTISIWAKRNTTGKTDPLMWQGPLSISEQRFLFGFNAQDELVCGFGGTDLITSGLTPDTEWHYWACSYDLETGERKLWKDGRFLAGDQSSPIPQMNENLYIGQAPVGSFEGYLDELVVLDHALNDEEIRHQYTAYQMIYHVEVEEDFVVPGDTIPDRSGYFTRSTIVSESPDIVNKSASGIVGDYALGFDGDDSLKVEPSFHLALDRAQFTQSAWIYPLNTGKEIGIFSHFDENPERRYPSMIIMPNQSIKVGFGNGYDWLQITSLPGVVPFNEWSLVTATYDGQTYRVYLNDLLIINSTFLSGNTPYPAEQFNIGENLTGLIDSIMIFPRALEPFEIPALFNAGWKQAVLENNGNQVSWHADVPFGLEGPYNLGVRASDGEGHVLTDLTRIQRWGGVVDSFPPRLSLTRVPANLEDPNLLYIEFEIYDTMLDPESIHQNLCEGITIEEEYFNSSWYLAGGVAPNTALYRIHGSCYADARTTEETGIVACDSAGNCSGATFPAMLGEKVYLPLVIGGGSQGSAVLPGENPQLEALLEKAESWPALMDQLSTQTDLPAPDAWVVDPVLTYQDVRSLMHLNIHGGLVNPESIRTFRVNIWDGDRLLVESQASLMGDVWNCFWPFVPGQPPQDGVYQLELILTDQSGNETRLWETITVDLRP